jgi:hypothetical protein
MDTNKRLLTVDDIFTMKGMPDGWSPNDFEYEQAQKTADDFNKKMLEAYLPKEQPKYMSLTNEADGSVVRGIMEQGKFREIPADRIATPQGTFTMMSPTNAAPVYLPDGSVAQNYTSADGMYGGAPPPLAGGGMAATNAPTAAPVQTPAPSPTPFPEGAVIRSKRDGQNYRIVNGQPVLVGP